jgi:hypothetical protein
MQHPWASAAAAIVVGLFASSPSRAETIKLRPRVYAGYVLATARPHDDGQVAQIWQMAEHVLSPHDPLLAAHSLVVTRQTLAQLQKAGIDLTVESGSVQQMVDDSYARYDAPVAAAPGAFGPFFAKVQQLDAIEAYLGELVAKSAGRAKLVSIGRSIEGRDIRALVISSRPDDAGRGSVIVTGTHHAREWLSPMVAMGIADALVNRYDADLQVRHVVDNLTVYVVPVVNPDGYVRTFSGNRLQRKNMHVGCNVDLNRNYATAFGQLVPKSCAAETFPGPMPFSEPESRAIKELAEKQAKLQLYVDYHSNGNQVMIPYAYTRDAPPGFERNRQWGNLLAAEAQLPARPAFALAQGEGGGALDWFREKYTDSLVVELPGRGFDPPAIGVAASVDLQWKGWIAVANLAAGDGASVDGGVISDAGVADAGGGAGMGGSAGSDATPDAAAGAAGSGVGGGSGSGGASVSGGRSGSGGALGNGSGGATGGSSAPPPSDAQEFAGGGFGCGVGGGERAPAASLVIAALLLGQGLRRRRRRN